MCKLESPQDRAIIYDFHLPNFRIESPKRRPVKPDWQGIVISGKVRLATDPMNLLKKYY
jgi:hypothetical protein